MTAEIVVHRASPSGGRRVDVHGENVGVAHGVADVSEFLRRAGLDLDPVEVAVSPLIEWRGAGRRCGAGERREPGGSAGVRGRGTS
ncbi:hypothetical protein [Streptomyces spectabilis]|uniref:Uncharacterized protein n=1 Tax=Streptomyces spectabilis TaxID=68270 RepID=A0A5P2XH88_STRST|nr:hypothetical protein [Streptomyces spectabilis]QEV63901.1 hypothetical protein CP982_38705 [Streptomyces spectabilis]